MAARKRAKCRRIGILTGGGDCPGLNAVIRAIAKTTMSVYRCEVYGIEDGFLGLIEGRYRRLYNSDVSGILNTGGTILGTTNDADPFAFSEEAKGKTMTRDVSARVIEHYQDLCLDALFCIGGDGTLHIANRFFKKGLNIIGVPKTIDNDLMETDYTFGFNTAVSIAMDAIDRLHTTASSHHRVMVIETMGRYAGWLALESGVAGGADVILIPEIPYSLDIIAQKVKQRSRFGKRFSIVVISEGAFPQGGKRYVKRIIKHSPDQVRLGGISNVVASQIEELTGLETRVTVLGHLQRGGPPSAFDRLLATRFGYKAVQMLRERKFGFMPALKGMEIVPVPISRAVRKLKLVSPNHPLIRAARAIGTCFGDRLD